MQDNNKDIEIISNLKSDLINAKIFENDRNKEKLFEINSTELLSNVRELSAVFSNLNINSKRNVYNQEKLKLFELLRIIINVNLDDIVTNFRNYDQNDDSYFDEGEYLELEYQNLLLLREILLFYIALKQ